jgi:hypothetical protein
MDKFHEEYLKGSVGNLVNVFTCFSKRYRFGLSSV